MVPSFDTLIYIFLYQTCNQFTKFCLYVHYRDKRNVHFSVPQLFIVRCQTNFSIIFSITITITFLGSLDDITTYKCGHSFESSLKTENNGVKIIVIGWILTKLFNIANRTNSRITPYFANIAGARSKGVFERYEPNKNCFVHRIHYIFIIRPSILTIIKMNLQVPPY